jgi:glycosyltransferase involved in cell wall biosynthesis
MRLKLVTYRYAPAIGGAENHARRLLCQFGDRLDVDVVTLLNSNRTDWLGALAGGERDQDQHYEVDGRTVTALGRWPAPVRRRLRALTPAYHLPGSFAPAAMGRLLAPHLALVAHGADVVHNPFMGREAFSLGAMLAAHKAGLPFVFTPLRHERPLGWNSPAFRRLYREADALIALSQGEARWLEGQGAPGGRLHVIGIGPLNDPAAPHDRALAAVPGSRRIVLFVGQMHAYKGFRELIGAARILQSRPDVVFVFAGPDVRGNAREFTRAGPNVKWLGAVDNETRDSLLNACSMLCVPSSRESFGGVLVEAWASGKPVVGGPAAATRELIEDGVDGFTVPQDPAAVADRVARLLDDPPKAAAMGARGREKVERRFSWEAIAAAHLAVYRQVREEGRRA